ncbi:HD-GYP domain-containing protein [Sneathiella sp. HT1-7]|uniref:HD-GYP domain-containing protein n=1 Tax=Sneathiella sp. HT1-7 TaxID=2887192 RepID=UPI001D138F57|nr:HD domain-containing phosphohydrolase [Sneathiella sp. HT1-7]MCC3304500.1 PAS domain-containing protein [Sneathiella sp. HT1-7]
MTDATAKLELNSFLSDRAPSDSNLFRKAPWKIAAFFLIVFAILGYFLCDYAIESRKQELVGELQKRLDVSAAGKAQVMETWLAGEVEDANRIAENELFKLFATEINFVGDGKLPKSLNDQLPYMQNAFSNFVNQAELIGAYLIGKDGRAYLASGNAPSLTDNQRSTAQAQYEKTEVTFLPLRASDAGLVFDFVLPIHAAQREPNSSGNDVIVGALLLTVPASNALSELLNAPLYNNQPDVTKLYQEADGKYYELFPLKPPFIAPQEDAQLAPGATNFQEIARENSNSVFSSGALVPNTHFVVFQQVSSDKALAPLRTYAMFVIGLAFSFLIIVFTVLVVIWLTLKGQSARALAQQYKEFADQINTQRRLLGSINNTIDELIGLTDPEGRYIYANPSLARVADYPLRSIPGKTDRELFGEKAARDLAEHDRKAIATEQTVNAFVEIERRDGTRILRIAKSRFLNEDGAFLGIVTVSSDITDYVKFQRRKEEMDRKAITVLAQMLEANDPYLSDHSIRMAQIANHISVELGLSPEMIKIINTGAHLSQIGKISIPREIREKDVRLSEKEQKVMQKHVLIAEKILSNADVEKEVLDAVTQINELLDGTGYPKGLTKDEIDMPARILGMADILIARISPRSYREAISVDEALRVFKLNPEKYDPEVVDAMMRFFETETGADFKANIEKSKKG